MSGCMCPPMMSWRAESSAGVVAAEKRDALRAWASRCLVSQPLTWACMHMPAGISMRGFHGWSVCPASSACCIASTEGLPP